MICIIILDFRSGHTGLPQSIPLNITSEFCHMRFEMIEIASIDTGNKKNRAQNLIHDLLSWHLFIDHFFIIYSQNPCIHFKEK